MTREEGLFLAIELIEVEAVSRVLMRENADGLIGVMHNLIADLDTLRRLETAEMQAAEHRAEYYRNGGKRPSDMINPGARRRPREDRVI